MPIGERRSPLASVVAQGAGDGIDWLASAGAAAWIGVLLPIAVGMGVALGVRAGLSPLAAALAWSAAVAVGFILVFADLEQLRMLPVMLLAAGFWLLLTVAMYARLRRLGGRS